MKLPVTDTTLITLENAVASARLAVYAVAAGASTVVWGLGRDPRFAVLFSLALLAFLVGGRRTVPLHIALSVDVMIALGIWYLFGPVSGAHLVAFVVVTVGATLLPPAKAWTLVGVAVTTVPAQLALHLIGERRTLPLFHPVDPVPTMELVMGGALQAVFLVMVGLLFIRIAQLLRRGIRALSEELSKEQELNRAKDLFIATIGHELRTPLTSVTGFAEVLLTEQLADSERTEFLRIVSRQAKELQGLIDDLLTFTRAEAGRLTFRPKEVDLTGEVRDTLEAMGDRAAGVEVRGEPTTVVADPLRIRQIVRNLVDNAIKYGRPPIRVVVADDLDGVVIRVEDGGPGIPPDEVQAAFVPYRRLVEDHTMSKPGIGLGLPLVQRLAELHGGRVTYERRAATSIFEVVLPIAGNVRLPDHVAHVG